MEALHTSASVVGVAYNDEYIAQVGESQRTGSLQDPVSSAKGRRVVVWMLGRDHGAQSESKPQAL